LFLFDVGQQILLWGNLASLDEDQGTENTSALTVDESEFLRWYNNFLFCRKKHAKFSDAIVSFYISNPLMFTGWPLV